MTPDILSRLAELYPALKDESSKRTLDEICEAVTNPWQGIASAPTHHAPVLTWSLAQGRCVAFLDVTNAWWSIPNGDGPMEHKPTHWTPLFPDRPRSAQETKDA